ncbi:MAG: hypothetical protein V4494_03070 [Chlamydiota bacterium]
MKDARCGDLLFVSNKENKRLLSHIALVIDVDKIFHCSPYFGTAVMQSREEFFSLYEQKLSFKKMICYIDPRNKELRGNQKGIFISE